MRRYAFWTLLFALLSASALHAQAIVSIWQGTVQSDSDQRRLQVQISKTDSGGMAATAVFIEFVPYAIHVDSSTVNASILKFTINQGLGSYAGTISAGGSTVQGTWTWNSHPVALTLQRTAQQTAWQVPFQYQYHYMNVTYPRPTPNEAKIPFSPRLAVDYMEQGALAWTAEWKCVACHTNGTYMMVRPLMTPQLGVPQEKLREFFVATLRNALAVAPAKRQTEVEPTQMVYVAAGLAIWDAHVLHRLSPETVQALNLMFDLQRPTGDWFIEDDNNPPLESSPFQLATVAARAVANAPGWLSQQRGTPVATKIKQLENYLRAEGKMQGDYDRTDLLWTASEFPGLLDDTETQSLIAMVFAHQQIDGGWAIRTFARPEQWGKGNRAAKLRAEPEFIDPPSDGHMTGLAIVALRKAGVSASDPRIQRGVAWLLANQRSSGRWWTRSLNRDGWQFISYSGTAYPLLALALCDSLPTGP